MNRPNNDKQIPNNNKTQQSDAPVKANTKPEDKSDDKPEA